MEPRNKLKKKGKKNLKKHYAIFMVTCLIAALIGTEFLGSTIITNIQSFPEAVIEKSEAAKPKPDGFN